MKEPDFVVDHFVMPTVLDTESSTSSVVDSQQQQPYQDAGNDDMQQTFAQVDAQMAARYVVLIRVLISNSSIKLATSCAFMLFFAGCKSCKIK